MSAPSSPKLLIGQRWPGPWRSPWVRFLVAVLAIVVLLKLALLGDPHRALTWDENYYIREAQNLIRSGHTLLTEHPPLGKYLIALSYRLGGLTLARLAAIASGLLIALLGALITWEVSGRPRAAALVGMLLSLDGYLFSETRFALLNPILYVCFLSSLYFLVRRPRPLNLPLAAVSAGFALATKWFAAPLLLFGWVRYRRSPRKVAGFLAIALLVYGLSCSPAAGLMPTGQWQYNRSLLGYHQKMDADPRQILARAKPQTRRWAHWEVEVKRYLGYGLVDALDRPLEQRRGSSSMTQPWYLWPLGNVQLYTVNPTAQPGQHFILAAVANPFIWMGASIAALLTLAVPSYRWLGLAFLSCWLPWAFTSRQLYSYSFCCALLVGSIALGLWLDRLLGACRISRILAISYLALCGSYFLFSLQAVLGIQMLTLSH